MTENFMKTYGGFSMGIKTKTKIMINALRLTQVFFLLSSVLVVYSSGFNSWALSLFIVTFSIGLVIESMKRKLLELRIEYLLNTNQIKEV